MTNIAIKNPENVCFNCLEEKTVHKIYIPQMGWGSSFDGFGTRINLCDNCIKLTNPEWWKLEIVKGNGESYKYEKEIFKFVSQLPVEGKELFYNRYASGWDVYIKWKPQDYIDYELGILSHEKCKEYGVYSPQEIQAYKEKFPICQYPVNIIYEDGSKSCWCPFEAYGEYGQKCDEDNISNECYQCKYFTQRATPIKDIFYNDWQDYKIFMLAKLNKDKYKKFE